MRSSMTPTMSRIGDIFSIYTEEGQHIGEGQLSIDEPLGDAQVSVLIGDKTRWHGGFGTAATLAMLEHIFDTLGLFRAWGRRPGLQHRCQDHV